MEFNHFMDFSDLTPSPWSVLTRSSQISVVNYEILESSWGADITPRLTSWGSRHRRGAHDRGSCQLTHRTSGRHRWRERIGSKQLGAGLCQCGPVSNSRWEPCPRLGTRTDDAILINRGADGIHPRLKPWAFSLPSCNGPYHWRFMWAIYTDWKQKWWV